MIMSSILRRGRGDHELREPGNVSRLDHHHPPRRFRVGRVKRTTTTLVVLPNGANVNTGLPVIMSSSSPESQNQCGKEFNSSPPCDAIFKYLIPTLVALLTLKYNGKTENPFETHPPNMWTFVIAICIYCLALGFKKEMKIASEFYSQILGYVTIISGVVSCVSLVSIFLPDLLGRLVLQAFLPIILAGILFKRVIVCYIGQRIVNAFDCVRDKFNNSSQRIANSIGWVRDKFNSARRNLMEQQPSLPTTSS